MKKNLRYSLIGTFFFVVVLLGTFKIVNFDFGWHLKAGEYICSNRTIPKTDIFSYLAQGNKWVDSHWLFQCVLFLFYNISGVLGSIILRTLVVLVTFLFLFFTIYKKEYYPVSIIFCLLALFLSLQRFLLRPEIFSFLFLSIFFYFLENYSEHPRLSLIIIPFCQILWVNMHGLYILGIVFISLYLIGDLLQDFFRKYVIKSKTIINKSEWRQKGLLFGLTFLALFVNANGIEGILYPFKIFSELKTKPSIFAQITELISPFSVQNAPILSTTVIYKIFLVLFIIFLLLQVKRLKLSHLLASGAFFYLSILAIRNIPLFAIIAVPVTIKHMNGILDFFHKKKNWGFPQLPLVSILLFFLLVGLSFFIINNGLYDHLHLLRTFGIGLSGDYPLEAVEYLKNKRIEGNIFNSSDIGGFLIWQLYPRKQVALDGRWEVYGSILDDIEKLKSPLYFAQLVKKHNIEAVILSKRSLEIHLMAQWLKLSPFWEMTKETQKATVFEKII